MSNHLTNFSVSLKQPNQMKEHMSTTTRFTRTGKYSGQTANTSALAWAVLLDVSPSANISSCCPNWAVPSPSGSRCRDGAVNNSSVLRRQRQRALWWRNTEKSKTKTDRLKTTLPTRTSWLLCGEENQIHYLVSIFLHCILSGVIAKEGDKYVRTCMWDY